MRRASSPCDSRTSWPTLSSPTRPIAVALRVLGVLAPHLHELRHHFFLARRRDAERRRVAVRLRVLARVLEARVAIPRPPPGLGIDFVEVLDDRVDRGVEAVEVNAVE